MKSSEKLILAASLMIAAAFLNSLDAIIVRSLAGEVHPLMIGFFRSFFGLLVIVPWMISRVSLGASTYRAWHVVRAGLKLASLIALFIAFAHAPLADATAINFTMPVFLVVGAWLFLGERVNLATIAGVAVGFVGIVLIIKPGSQSFDPWLLFALAGAVLTAASQLMLRRMTLNDSPDQLIAWNLLVTVPLAFVIMLPVWTTPTLPQIFLLALQGVLGALNMSIITTAFSNARASFLAPFDFLRLPLVAALAFVFFGESASAATWIGGGVIFFATLIATSSGRLFNR